MLGLVTVLAEVSAAATVTVYILDNGVRADHEAFEGINIQSVDFVKSTEQGTESLGYGDHATLVGGLVVVRDTVVPLV